MSTPTDDEDARQALANVHDALRQVFMALNTRQLALTVLVEAIIADAAARDVEHASRIAAILTRAAEGSGELAGAVPDAFGILDDAAGLALANAPTDGRAH